MVSRVSDRRKRTEGLNLSIEKKDRSFDPSALRQAQDFQQVQDRPFNQSNRPPKTQAMEIKQDFWVYPIRCADGSYYTGSTHELEQRLRAHEDGRAAPYTIRRRPLFLVYSERHGSMKTARRRELQIKRWTRKKKEALIKGI